MSRARPLREMLKQLTPKPEDPLARAGIAPGLYHAMREIDGSYTRFHLRVDRSGQGLLLANATAAARLNPSGVVMAKGILDGASEETLLRRLSSAFRNVSPEQAKEDIERVRRLFADLEAPGDNYPILNLADPTFTKDALPLEKPFSADIPLADLERLVPLLDRLWELGVPHATFIVEPSADTKDLVRAVERAEDLGMIAGVRARASDLVDDGLIRELAQTGVDHLNFYYLSSDEHVHDSLVGAGDWKAAKKCVDRALENEVCPVAEVVLVRATLENVVETMESIATLGVRNAGFVGIAAGVGELTCEALSEEELAQAAEIVKVSADDFGLRLLWYPPARFDVNAALAKQIRRAPRCSGEAAMRLEVDGSVIPTTGPFHPVGNLFADPWSRIAWQ